MTVYGSLGGERGDQMWVGREALKALATTGPRSEEDIEEYLSNAATSNEFGWLGDWQGGAIGVGARKEKDIIHAFLPE